jgi:hypothetical protein
MADHTAIELPESTSYHMDSMGDNLDEYTPEVQLLLERGLFVPAVHYIQAQRARAVLVSKVSSLQTIRCNCNPHSAPDGSPCACRRRQYEISFKELMDEEDGRYPHRSTCSGCLRSWCLAVSLVDSSSACR